MKRLLLSVALATALASTGGCFLFHDDYPDDTCENDLECFRSQGETCNLTTNRCEVQDTGAPAPVPDEIHVSADGSEEEVSYGRD